MHKLLLIGLLTMISFRGNAQHSALDELFKGRDTTQVMDSLMEGFEAFMDSVSVRKSFLSAGITAGTALFSYERKNSIDIENRKKLIVSPSLGYFHRSGFGLNAAAYLLQEQGRYISYVYNLSPSFDLVRRKYSVGAAFTKSFFKDSLPFYTTPLQQEAFVYFTYKGLPVRPMISMSYGWGTSTSFREKKMQIYKKRLKQARTIYITEKNEASIHDLSINFSLRKDFNFFGLVSSSDMLSITPVIMLNCGTQQYGFNTSYDHSRISIARVNALPSNSSITGRSSFTAQSAAFILRGAYLYKRLMLQPQFIMDYFIPGKEEQLNAAFSFTANVTF